MEYGIIVCIEGICVYFKMSNYKFLKECNVYK